MGEEPLFRKGGRARISDALIGRSAAMSCLRDRIAQLAPRDVTVLLTGPTGSGKENAARALHAGSGRAGGRFEAVNCGAIPADLAEAELFGAEAGAFTGATRARIGRIEAAHGGTLFLDEVGDLPLPLQVKLLRVLETREVERLGGGRPVPVDIRVIAATHVDLEDAVASRTFREDLYWRLAVLWMEIPPLAARTEDIPELVAHFASRSGETAPQLTACGCAALAAHAWPGNLRELRNMVERALALGETRLDAVAVGRVLNPRRRPMDTWLQGPPQTMQAPVRPMAPAGFPGEGLPGFQLKALMAEAEAALIAQALEASGGTIAGSARMLGLKRTTLVEKMKRMGLKAPANEAA